MKDKKPFPQFIDPHPHQTFYWLMLFLIVAGIGAGLSLSIYKFSIEQEEWVVLREMSAPKFHQKIPGQVSGASVLRVLD